MHRLDYMDNVHGLLGDDFMNYMDMIQILAVMEVVV